ncbi:hypothetical protein HMI56_001218 [Coelomomyces lativittatus]|nr:hypothetical protein HMI56_001218 [Coelomomyces lativittatus]
MTWNTMFKQSIRGQGPVRSPLAFLRDAPEIFPLAVFVAFPVILGIPFMAKKLYFEMKKTDKEGSTESWNDDFQRLQEKLKPQYLS